MPDRLLHLLVGALIIAAYFLVTPAYLWQPPPGLVPLTGGTLSEADWQQQSLDWPETIIGAPALASHSADVDWLYWTGDQGDTVYRATLRAGQAPPEPQPWLVRKELDALLPGPSVPLGQALLLPGRWDGELRLLLQRADQLVLLALDLQGKVLRLVSAKSPSLLARTDLRLAHQGVSLVDGSVAVLLYHSGAGQAYWQQLDPGQGRWLSRRALPADGQGRPLLLAGSSEQAALIRGADDGWQLLASATVGHNWQRLARTLPGATGSGSALVLKDGSWLWNAPCEQAGRAGRLCLWHSKDYGNHWQPLASLAACSAHDCQAGQAVMALYAPARGPLQLFHFHPRSGWQWARQGQPGEQP